MERDLATEIIHRGIANLANSPAIGCDPRLALNNFISQSRCHRINQRFLKFIRHFPERLPVTTGNNAHYEQICQPLLWGPVIKGLKIGLTDNDGHTFPWGCLKVQCVNVSYP
ncbi:MAG TPA: hypothetical protein ENI97_01225 [Gammaproteobacteria bacterium]|nr:hypothetical protein [Gammaproteobacteria bacterium]